jgi:hypothetical protein
MNIENHVILNLLEIRGFLAGKTEKFWNLLPKRNLKIEWLSAGGGRT